MFDRTRPLFVATLALVLACARASHHDESASGPSAGESSPHRLPTGLHLDPAGRSIAVGNMPLSALASRDGRFLVVSLSGWRDHERWAVTVEEWGGRRTRRPESRTT